VVNDEFRAAAVVNVWLPPAATLLWTAPAVPPRPVVNPVLCADAVAKVWLPAGGRAGKTPDLLHDHGDVTNGAHDQPQSIRPVKRLW
jgi:hypothetical protein